MYPKLFKEKDFKRLFTEMKKKYKKYGRVTGKIKLENLNESEVIAFEEIGKFFNLGESINFNLKELKQFLSDSIYSEFELETILFDYFGNEFIKNADKKELESYEREEYFNDIINKFKDSVAYDYLYVICFENKSIYKTVSLRYNEDKKSLKQELFFVGKALNSLPYLNDGFQNIAMFSELITGDPHYFDETEKHFIFLFEGIKYIKNISRKINSVVEKNKLFFEVGLIKESIFNSITIYGFRGIRSDKEESKILNSALEEKEYLNLSINNLNSIEYFKPISNQIYIFENPSVFTYVFDYLKKSNQNTPALICTAGQLNFSAYQFFDKLMKCKKSKEILIYYSGDIDPEGMLIADNLLKRYEEIKLLAYSKDTYLQYLSGQEISERSLKKLDSLSNKELMETAQVMRVKKEKAYQERFVGKILEKIKNI